MLGVALAGVINLVDVDSVVLGGPLGLLHPYLDAPLRAELDRRVITAAWRELSVRPSANGPLGAAGVARWSCWTGWSPIPARGSGRREPAPDRRRCCETRRRGPAGCHRLTRMSSRVLTAVAWPYANGPRHIGHVSGFGVPSDVFSRYMRMSGHDVLMVSGTDEHGTPIQVQAEREGLTNREAADKYNRVIVEDLQGLGLSYDLFTRTTTRNHYAVVAGAVPRAAPQRLRRAARPRWGRSARRPAGRCPTATSRAPARSAATTARAATSATTAATSSTRST